MYDLEAAYFSVHKIKWVVNYILQTLVQEQLIFKFENFPHQPNFPSLLSISSVYSYPVTHKMMMV